MMNEDKALLLSHRPGDELAFEGKDQQFARALGGRVIAVDRESGVVALRFAPGPEYLQGMGVVQGGVVSAMLDYALGFAGMVMTDEGFVIATATLNVAFLRPVLAGIYVATGMVERRGRTLIFVRGELRAEGGAVVATGTSSLVVVKDVD